VSVRQRLLDIAKVVLPDRFIEWYRRRRAYRKYAHALAYQVYDREVRLELEDVEGRVAAHRQGFTDRVVRDVLERTELVLQGLDRKIEGVSSRHGQALRELRAEVEALRAELTALRALAGETAAPAQAAGELVAGEPAAPAELPAGGEPKSVPVSASPVD
jgi:hypothetical protein